MSLIYISRTMETRVEHEFVLKSLSLSRTEKFVRVSEKLNARNLKIGRAKRDHAPQSLFGSQVRLGRSLPVSKKKSSSVGKNLVDLVAGSVEV